MLLLAGCAGPFFRRKRRGRSRRGVGAAQLAAGSWRGQPGVFLLEQRAEFDFHGRKLEMRGMMQLDMTEGRARLMAVDDLGIKLFDLTVTRDGQTLHDVLPRTGQISPARSGGGGFGAAHFSRAPAGSGRSGRGPAPPIIFFPVLEGRGADLHLRRAAAGPATDAGFRGRARWQVDYYQYHRQKGADVSGGDCPFRRPWPATGCTLWLDSMRRTDE